MPGVNTMSKSVSGFDPRSIPGCTLWLDAADPNVFTFSSGANISTWRDKSVNGTIVSVDTGTPQLTQFNNLNSVFFNGSTRMVSSSYTRLAGATNINWFVIANITNVNLTYGLLIGTNYSADFFSQNSLYVHSNNLLHFFRQTYGAAGNSVSRSVTNGPFLGSTSTNLSNGNYSVFVNGVGTSATGGPTGTQDATAVNLYLGNDNYPGDAFITGNICECILYTSDLTTAQRQAVEGYLAWKWGLEEPSSFIPTSIPGCVLWFDASDPTSIIRSGTTITQVRDKSGLGNHTTAVTGTNTYVSGLNNLPTISFNGTGFFTGSFATAITDTTLQCFIVGTINTATGQFGRMISLGAIGTSDFDNVSSCIPFVRGNNTASVYSVRNNVANPSAYIPITFDVPFVGQVSFDGTNMNTSVNGGTIFSSGSTGSFNITGYALGTNTNTAATQDRHFGFISEVLIYRGSVFTAAQRSLIEGYLASKWGISGVPSSALPSTHPFLSGPPSLRLWVPSDLGITPEYWFDAADRTTITASGTNLTTLTNKGSAGSAGNITVNAGTATTSTTRINGNNLIVLPSGTRLQFTSSFPIQVRSRFFATRPTQSGAIIFLYQGATALNGYDLLYITADPFLAEVPQSAGGFRMQTGTIPSQVNNFAIYTFVNAATTVNNRIAITGQNRSLDNFNLVAANYFTGSVNTIVNNTGAQDLGEIISYNTELTLSQQQLIEGYLAWKWGINKNLPTTHPFYFGPPTTPISLGISVSLAPGNGSCFLARYNTNGIIQWAARMLSPAFFGPTSVSYDPNNNIYVGGYMLQTVSIYNQNAVLPSLTISPFVVGANFYDAFVIKYTNTGIALWAVRMTNSATGNQSTNSVTGVSADNNGNLYAVGNYNAGTFSIYNSNGTVGITLDKFTVGDDVFLVRYLSDGTTSWAARINGDNTNQSRGIATTSAGDIHICGYFTSTTLNVYNSGRTGTLGRQLSKIGNTPGFVIKYTTVAGAGPVSWAARITGSSYDYPNAIAVDTNGNVYVTGVSGSLQCNIYTQNVTSPAITLTNDTSDNNVFVAKYNSAGTALWAAKMGSGIGLGIAADINGNVYVTGLYSVRNPFNIFSQGGSTAAKQLSLVGVNDYFIVKYDTGGTVQWAARISNPSGGGQNIDNGIRITVDSLGNPTITGYYRSTLTIYNQDGSVYGTLALTGTYNIFLIKYTTNGNVVWAARSTGSLYDLASSISADPNGNINIFGQYYSNPFTLNSAGS